VNFGYGGNERSFFATTDKTQLAKKEPLQECSDPKKIWTTQDIDRHRPKDDPLCESGTAQRTYL
jgi:hypothetical protein